MQGFHNDNQLPPKTKGGEKGWKYLKLSKQSTHSNINLAANNPGLPDPNHSKFHLPSRKGDLDSWGNKLESYTKYKHYGNSLFEQAPTLLVEVLDWAAPD